MTRILMSILAISVLAGCGTPAVSPMMQTDATSAQAQAKATVVGTVAKYELAGKNVLTMSLEAKRPLLKNISQISTYYTFFDKETRRWRGSASGSALFLAKDGGIYISTGPTNTELWYRVGTYQASQLQPGLPVSYVLDGEHTFNTSKGIINLDIYHAYKTRTGSEMEWSTQAPRLFEVK